MRIRRVVWAIAAASLLAGCGGATQPRLTHRVVTRAAWRAVLADWYDGKLDGRHSCAAVAVASAHVPPDGGPTYSTVLPDLIRYAQRVCTHRRDLRAIRAGLTDEDVATLAGPPGMPTRQDLWVYWYGGRSSAGLAVWFRHGRVTRTGRIVHL